MILHGLNWYEGLRTSATTLDEMDDKDDSYVNWKVTFVSGSTPVEDLRLVAQRLVVRFEVLLTLSFSSLLMSSVESMSGVVQLMAPLFSAATWYFTLL